MSVVPKAATTTSSSKIPSDIASLTRFCHVESLFASSEDGEVVFDVVRSGSATDGNTQFLSSADDSEGSKNEILPNGVSLSNWLPSKWSKKEWFVSVRLSKLSNALCFGGLINKTFPNWHESGQLVLTERKRLVDASYGVWNGERLLPRDLLSRNPDGSFDLKREPSGEHLKGDYLLIGNMQPHFGHTILEGLSRLWPLHQQIDLPLDVKFLVYEPVLADFQRELLKRSGVDLSRIFHVPREGVSVERLWIADPSIRSHRWISRLQSDVWRAISDSVFTGEPERMTYLSRSNIAERPLTNECEIEALFQHHGFDIVCPETLSLEEQIRIAAESRCIAGPVGSQMYLAAFQKAGALKIVLAPRNFYAKDDQLISSVTSVLCEVIFGSEIDHFAERQNRRWTIESDDVAKILKRIMQQAC